MRLFLAVNLSQAMLDAVGAAVAAVPVTRPPWRWSARETWHVTLKFIGQRPPADVERIAAALARVGGRHAPFDLALGGLDGFPNLRRPRVLFYRVAEGEDPVAALARDVDAAVTAALALEPEGRPFHAHVTVARIKTSPPGAVLERLGSSPPVAGPVQRVESFDLMESQTGRGGAKYTRLKQFALSGGK